MNFFFEYMSDLLGAEFDAFRDAYFDKPRHKALRVNTARLTAQEFVSLADGYKKRGVREYALRQNPLCENSFYTTVKPSLDPLYHAGLYYMQEPSASAPVAAFAPYIGERVLDLCSAPGGKGTQAAEKMRGGVIFCNDVEQKRVRALEENIERLGITNAVVTRNTAEDYLNAGFKGYFDTVIVDAPCSGAGMMRYENVPFTPDIVEGCAKRQRRILSSAAALLAVGGYMLYSTCTFTTEENEDNVAFLRSLGLASVDIPLRDGEERGIGEADARRIYPHRFDGEGQFYCIFKKPCGESGELEPARSKRGSVKLGALKLSTVEISGRILLPIAPPQTDGLNVVRMGTSVWENGGISHALTHALGKEQIEKLGSVEIGEAAERYIRGDQLDIPAPRSASIATVDGFALGAVRSALSGDGAPVLKNKYPKHLRIR